MSLTTQEWVSHLRQRCARTFCWMLVFKLKSSCYLAGFLQLSASFPGLREHGADNALGTDVSGRLGVRNSTVGLIRVIWLRFCLEENDKTVTIMLLNSVCLQWTLGDIYWSFYKHGINVSSQHRTFLPLTSAGALTHIRAAAVQQIPGADQRLQKDDSLSDMLQCKNIPQLYRFWNTQQLLHFGRSPISCNACSLLSLA